MKITEIFLSLQGETKTVGIPTVFVRLTGCPLRCSYCDTHYAFSTGINVSIEEVMTRIKQYKTKYITVTGGEPLAQKTCLTLLEQLCDAGYIVSLETSGALDMRLSAGESLGLSKVVSAPKIITLDNKPAKIEQGSQIPFATTSLQGTQTTFVDATLALNVTPHVILHANMVRLEIKATN